MMRAPRPGAMVLVLVLLLAAWRLWRPPSDAANLEIGPDSIEYAVSAQRFALHDGYNLVLSGVTRPPRYAPWFSVGLLAPAIALGGGAIGNAILPVFATALASIAAAFFIGKRLAGWWGAAGASLALLLNPAFAVLARVVMTEIPSLAFGLAACRLYLSIPEPPPASAEAPAHWRRPMGAGLLGAAAFALRAEGLAILLPFAWTILRGRPRVPGHLALLALPSLVVAAATGCYNAATFGSWHRTGYQYWCPVPYEFPSLVFGLRYIPANLASLSNVGRASVLALGAVGAAILLVFRRSESARPALLFFALAALPGTLFHLVYFYPEARFHIVLLAAASVIGGAGLGSVAALLARDKLWPIPLAIALAAAAPQRAPAQPYRRATAEAIARETPTNAVIVSGYDPVFLEPYLLRGSARTIVPASRSVEYASKLVAPLPIRSIDPPPRGPDDTRAPGLLRAGAVDPCPLVATEAPQALAAFVRAGRPVFIDASFLPDDAPLGRIIDPSLFVTPSARAPWLGELHARDPAPSGR